MSDDLTSPERRCAAAAAFPGRRCGRRAAAGSTVCDQHGGGPIELWPTPDPLDWLTPPGPPLTDAEAEALRAVGERAAAQVAEAMDEEGGLLRVQVAELATRVEAEVLEALADRFAAEPAYSLTVSTGAAMWVTLAWVDARRRAGLPALTSASDVRPPVDPGAGRSW